MLLLPSFKRRAEISASGPYGQYLRFVFIAHKK
jgi:hypothetical protein